jgi:hypothetical protein
VVVKMIFELEGFLEKDINTEEFNLIKQRICIPDEQSNIYDAFFNLSA